MQLEPWQQHTLCDNNINLTAEPHLVAERSCKLIYDFGSFGSLTWSMSLTILYPTSCPSSFYTGHSLKLLEGEPDLETYITEIFPNSDKRMDTRKALGKSSLHILYVAWCLCESPVLQHYSAESLPFP